MDAAEELIVRTAAFVADLAPLRFAPPVAACYQPLDYAGDLHRQYLRRFARRGVSILFVGMNPGPWGMAQTGVPFGEVAAVRDWMGLSAPVRRPADEHPKRPVQGLDCPKSEVSGRRLWGLMRERFGTAERFFDGHAVANWCPLAFMSASGANLTPETLPQAEFAPLAARCDRFLAETVDVLAPQWVVGVGGFAVQRIRMALPGHARVGSILHPSPASPAANRDWAGQATRQLVAMGAWPG